MYIMHCNKDQDQKIGKLYQEKKKDEKKPIPLSSNLKCRRSLQFLPSTSSITDTYNKANNKR